MTLLYVAAKLQVLDVV